MCALCGHVSRAYDSSDYGRKLCTAHVGSGLYVGNAAGYLERLLDDVVRNWGRDRGPDVRAPSARRRSTVPRLVGPLRSAVSESERGKDDLESDCRHRRPPRVAGNPGAHAHHPQRGRSGGSGRGQPVRMATRIPGAKYVELPAGVDHVLISGNSDADSRRDRRVPHRSSAWTRAGPRARHGIVHRHRRLDRARPPSWATGGAGGSCSTHHTPLVRERLAHFRGREIDTAGDGFLAILRRPGARRAMPPAPSAERVSSVWGSRCVQACTPASAKWASSKLTVSRCTSARALPVSPRVAEVLVLEHGQGPRGRLGTEVRRPRPPRAEGRAEELRISSPVDRGGTAAA